MSRCWSGRSGGARSLAPSCVSTTHQRGCRLRKRGGGPRRRGLIGEEAEAGRPAARHGGNAAARLRGQRRLDVGDGRQQRGRRSLEVVAAPRMKPTRPPRRPRSPAALAARPRRKGAAARARKTLAVARGRPGLTRTAGIGGSAADPQRLDHLADARISAGTPARQTGTSAPSRAATSCQATAPARSGLARRTARSSAAASAEPPPSPAATGRFFSSATVPSCRPASSSRAGPAPVPAGWRRRCRAANGPPIVDAGSRALA